MLLTHLYTYTHTQINRRKALEFVGHIRYKDKELAQLLLPCSAPLPPDTSAFRLFFEHDSVKLRTYSMTFSFDPAVIIPPRNSNEETPPILHDAPISITLGKTLRWVPPGGFGKLFSSMSVSEWQEHLASTIERFMMVVGRPRHWFRLKASRYRLKSVRVEKMG